MTEFAIKTEDLTYFYPPDEGEAPKNALESVTVGVEAGKFTVILGHNGSGKSTLARHMNALLLPKGGKVYAFGMDTADEKLTLDIRRKVGMVFQNPDNQIVSNVVEEDVAFAPENLGIPTEEIRIRVDEALKTVGMYEFREHAPHLLSGGQKQRVAIAGVLAMRPNCVVFDESTAMLDPRGRRDVMDIIRRLRAEGVTVILITHHMEEAVEADNVIVMDGGRIALQGTPREIFKKTDEIRALGLALPDTVKLINRLNASGFSLNDEAITVSECAGELLKTVSGAHITAPVPAETKTVSEPVLSVKELTHVYSKGTPFELTALKNINVDIYPGEVAAIIGHTGSGKSTLIQHLNGLIKPSQGKIILEGKDINSSKENLKAARSMVGLVFQYPEYQLFEETVYKDIAFGPKNQGLSDEEIDERVKMAAGFVGIGEELFEASPFELSGGQKRRIAIAGVIAMRPEILVLDEPMAGLDPAGREEIMDNLLAYHRKTGASLVIVTHSMDDAAKYADRMIVLTGGEVALEGCPSAVFSQDELLESIGLSVPTASLIARSLREGGAEIEGTVYTVDALAEALTAWKGGVAGA